VREGLTNYEALHCLCVCPPVGSHLSKYLYFSQCSLKFVVKMEPKHVSILSIQYFLSTNNCKKEYEKLVVKAGTVLRKEKGNSHMQDPLSNKRRRRQIYVIIIIIIIINLKIYWLFNYYYFTLISTFSFAIKIFKKVTVNPLPAWTGS
jgi:hypothetical protein